MKRKYPPNRQRPRAERSHRKEESSAPRERDVARWVVGIHSCFEAVKVRPRAVRELWLREDWSNSQQLKSLHDEASANRIQIRERTQGQLDTVGPGHQGAAIACLESPVLDWKDLEEAETALILILDEIEDPHNLGSILRTAWLTGVSAIFVPADRAVGLTPAVCKVASGGAEHVPVEVESNLSSLMERLKKIGFWTYGLGEGGSRKPWEFQLARKTAWVVGSEVRGLRKPVERACDELVRIPQVASGSSYNAAIACAMALAETCRQFGRPD